MADSIHLIETSPSLKYKFEEGYFVVRKTQRKFSALAMDHANDQNNKFLKSQCKNITHMNIWLNAIKVDNVS